MMEVVSTQPNQIVVNQTTVVVSKENVVINTIKKMDVDVNVNVTNSQELALDGCKKLVSDACLSQQSSAATTPVILENMDNILSPPKSEIQTDDTNTATSSSPASDAHISSVDEQLESTEMSSSRTTDVAANEPRATPPASPAAPIEQTIPPTAEKPATSLSNGALPKTGKPLAAALNQKQIQARKQKPTLYKSEISDNKIGIKLCIKKPQVAGYLNANSSSNKKKRIRKATNSSLSTTEPVIKRKKEKLPTNAGEVKKSVSFASGVKEEESSTNEAQSVWGNNLPENVLYQIFKLVVDAEGCLPTLCRLSRVCSLWRRVALSSTLWHNLDLSGWIKEKYRTELKLKWFLDNRCSSCTELNVSNWKITDVNCFLQKLAKGCPNLKGINLTGWKGFNNEHLVFLVDNMKHLERLDLTAVNAEKNANKSAVGIQSLSYALATLNKRLTHLYLAQNRMAGIPQIVNMLAVI